ncbi:MAG TPA: hypothetical protein VHV31_01285, partial [Nitrolancea sp.]|nr:hypothetical protein [Nitrolancea sp.]
RGPGLADEVPCAGLGWTAVHHTRVPLMRINDGTTGNRTHDRWGFSVPAGLRLLDRDLGPGRRSRTDTLIGVSTDHLSYGSGNREFILQMP